MTENSPDSLPGRFLTWVKMRLRRQRVEPLADNDFFRGLRDRWERGREVPLAALIYGLIDVHRKRRSVHTEISDSNPDHNSSREKVAAGVPGVLDLLYHPERGYAAVVFSNPELLRYVVDRYDAEHHSKAWEFRIWKAVTGVACCATSGNRGTLRCQITKLLKLLGENCHEIPQDQAGRASQLYRLYVLCLYINAPKNAAGPADTPAVSIEERREWCLKKAQMSAFATGIDRLFEVACAFQERPDYDEKEALDKIDDSLRKSFPLECLALEALLHCDINHDKGGVKCQHCPC